MICGQDQVQHKLLRRGQPPAPGYRQFNRYLRPGGRGSNRLAFRSQIAGGFLFDGPGSLSRMHAGLHYVAWRRPGADPRGVVPCCFPFPHPQAIVDSSDPDISTAGDPVH